MAKAMAGGASRNSIKVATPARYPPVGPNARRGVSEGATGAGNAARKFGEAEDERGVHRSHAHGRDHKTQGAGRGPTVAPSEVLPGDHKANGEAPQLKRSERSRKVLRWPRFLRAHTPNLNQVSENLRGD